MPKKATKKVVRRKAAAIEPTPKGLDFSEIFDKALEKIAAKNKKNVSDFDAGLRSALVGVPLGNLALEICFNESVLGLGRVICLDGMPGTCKSSLMWELCRIVDKAGGASCVIDTEQKATENLGQGIVGYDNWHKIKFVSPETLEEAFQILTGTAKLLKDSPAGNTMPLLIGMDSLGGIVTESEADKIDSVGTSARGFAENALLTARYINYITKKISGCPILVVGVRHERLVDSGYGKVAEAKGAGEVGFAAFSTYHLAKIKDEDQAARSGRKILVHSKKSTDPGTKVPVTMWWNEEITENLESLRHIWWDWDTATFELLTTHDNKYLPKRKIAAVKDILGPMSASSGANKGVICKPLGLTTSASPTELCQALYHPDNKQILDHLRAVFSIRVGQEFRYGDSFKDLKQKQRAIILARRSQINTSTGDHNGQEESDEENEDNQAA